MLAQAKHTRGPDAPYTDPLSLLEVDLDAAARNWLFLKKKMKTGADCGAVVKADGYGLGAAAIAAALHAQNCRHFFVASFDEGIELRRVLPAKHDGAVIYLFHGPYDASPRDIAEHSLVPILNTPGDVSYWADFARSSGKRQPAVLHIDTGMSRLGLDEKDLAWLVQNKDLLKAIDLRYVMSHLACADEPQHPKNRQQLDRFRALTEALGAPCRYSLSNSAGVLLGEDYHFDLARPGCGIYGINPLTGLPNPMHNVATLKSRILQVREIAGGETVGYGATYTAPGPVRCATVATGYATGYLRSLSNGRGTVVIGGVKCPVLGRVSMNSIVVDIGAVKTPLREGDWAEVIGAHQSADDLAREAGTIGYEILTSLGGRFRKVYTGG